MDDSQEIVKKVRVKNRQGIHTRPAATIVKILHNCKCQVSFTYKKMTINAKSILGILTLAIPRNGLITIRASGEDAQDTMDNLIENFENGFGEDALNGI